MDNYNEYVNDYMNSYNCPDCSEAKLQSDKNARKINEVIEQVNALIQVIDETSEFIEEKTNELVREILEEQVDEIVGETVGDIAEEKVSEVIGGVVEDLSEVIIEVNSINTSLENLEIEVNELKEGNIDIDLTDYATKDYVDDAINNAKLEGGDTQIDLSSYAKKSDLHSHSNKSVLDNITNSKVNQWDNKSDFSGNYNDLTNKPTIPTKTSELTNNSGFITSIPSEYVTETELSAHTGNATTHITASERNNWNNKSNFDGNYNNLTNKPTSLPANGGNASTVGGYSLWVGTQAQYNAISTKSDTTVYIIKEE